MAQLKLPSLCLKLVMIGFMALSLTGCIDYDIGIQFDSQTHGTLTQTLHLDERLGSLNQTSTEQWLKQFERRAKSLSARVKRLDAATIQVTIPFHNGDGLIAQFNRIFSNNETSLFNDVPGLPPLTSSLSLDQKNYLLALQNHLEYDLDLRQLKNLKTPEQGLIGNLRVLNLQFHLITPWGLQIEPRPGDNRSGDKPENGGSTGLTNVIPKIEGRETVWQLTPGAINHIDVTFWIPSPIGIGALAIAILMGLGYGLKYGIRPSPSEKL